MTSVITGDIIKSRNIQPAIWLASLETALSALEPDTKYWDIYRGDSFQVEIRDIYLSFMAAIYIKSCVKMNKDLDVRLAIGIGKKTYSGSNVTESNGEAFIFSGETLESLKKEKQNLKIKTPDPILDQELNLYFKLALITMDKWTVNSAEIVKLSIEHPNMLQKELAKIIGTNQDAISKRQKRANLEALLELDAMYKQKLSDLS